MTRTNQTDEAPDVEVETQQIGHQIWDRLHRRAPSIFDRRWWEDRILAWAMSDETVKVQMFRFVDVLPMLRTHESVTRHLQEYFEEVDEHLPGAVRLVLEFSQPNSVLGRALAVNARTNARRMAQRFIAGSHVDEVLQTVGRMRKQGFAFTLDLLGEAVISDQEADQYQQSYLNLINGMAPHVNTLPEDTQIDCDHRGPIPRINVSLKLSALCSQFRPVAAQHTAEVVKSRLRPILRAAQERGAHVHVDMEQFDYKSLTIEIFKQVLMEDEFRKFADVGIVIQAYLDCAQRDLTELLDWVKQRGTPIWIRLVKGAYWDYETIVAQARGWPTPVFQQKWQSDDNFERQSRFLLENYQWLRPAFGSHNLRSLSHCIALARQLNVPKAAYELQVLYGMAGEQSRILTELGHRVRVYTPFGELIPGMAYLVRRLLENTSNDSFIRHSVAEHVSVEKLIMKPADVGATLPAPDEPPSPAFVNEPLTDFSDDDARDRMQEALDDVKAEFGDEYPLLINGRAIDTKGKLLSKNPSHKAQILGSICSASPDDAVEAVESARRAFREWSRIEPHYRAEYLQLIANELREHRFELAAWEIYECGKTWAEADADVAEAIDFCVYYAQQMLQMAVHKRFDVPGEENSYFYRPRGVAVIIAPWNFPLAILTGMTTAALVTGNTVVMKPAEQASIVAAKFMKIIGNAGIPDGVVNFLPGVGEEVGPELVGSPEVDLIAFTGSRTVGLAINQIASETDSRQTSVKKVLAEMGGKNAIIIDEDADLDEAVLGVVQSAFNYAGQKCSACSRVIVLDVVYDLFLDRLVEATKSLPVGAAELAETVVGPVIDDEARRRIREYIEIGTNENRLAWGTPVDHLANEGHYVGPHIFADVDPSSRLAQEEIFGPVLAVIKAKTFDEALDIANDTDYALTGGIYSRSPVNLERAKREFLVGNLYLNRSITGALVERQPFGGFKMSGIGAKAGGPDYLQQFIIPVSVSENTMRRGFAPTDHDDEPTTPA